jgi:ornithine cyclodeaminase/alanine dehydrogenase-like protein (mu-crystallin family)
VTEADFRAAAGQAALADVLLGRVQVRRNSDDVTMHCSVGLAGSELLLALRLINQS